MNNEVNVPEEAVEAACAAVSQYELRGTADGVRKALQAAAPFIAAKAVEEAGREKAICPDHGDLCGRPNWTGYCRWRAERIKGQPEDYYDALSAAESRIDELKRERDQAIEQEREGLRGAVASAIERAAGPLGRARVRSGGSESRTEQARDLAEVAAAITILRAALAQKGDDHA